MAKNNEDYVSFEQAVKLKELGFDWDCNHWYHPLETDKIIECQTYCNHNSFERPYSAPTLYQAQKWLREKEIEVGVFAEFDGELQTGKWVWLMRKFNTHLYDTVFPEDINYDTYEQALSAGIDEALELLKSL